MGSNLFNSNVNKGLPAAPQGHNLGNLGWDAQSPTNDWLNNFRPDSAQWQGGGGDNRWGGGPGTPGRLGQDQWWNSQTGQVEYTDRPGLSATGLTGTNQTSIWSIDPITGNKVINMDAIRGMMQGGGGGGGDYQNYQVSDYGGGNISPGEGYGGYEYKDAMVDPSAAIAAQEYGLQENMQADFAKAGGRAGASGFNMSTPYMSQLGEAARMASQDRNAIAMQYQYDASSRAADREQQQEMQAAQYDFGGWQQHGNWDMQAQMQNQQSAFNEWMATNQWGFQDNQGQNQWNQQQQQYNQQNQYNQQQMLMNLMGGGF
jgi:hypothetical protein